MIAAACPAIEIYTEVEMFYSDDDVYVYEHFMGEAINVICNLKVLFKHRYHYQQYFHLHVIHHYLHCHLH